ncbi:hypothetical protein IT570_01680 [Candidatus Sumerlaeota bacterium]|nr:hypothetical protein [Candidatus Sumerlaeota bacterium]
MSILSSSAIDDNIVNSLGLAVKVRRNTGDPYPKPHSKNISPNNYRSLALPEEECITLHRYVNNVVDGLSKNANACLELYNGGADIKISVSVYSNNYFSFALDSTTLRKISGLHLSLEVGITWNSDSEKTIDLDNLLK